LFVFLPEGRMKRIGVHLTNSAPNQSLTNSTPILKARAYNSQGIAQEVISQATAVIGTLAFGNPFVPPTNPTQHPTIPCGSTDTGISTIIRHHNEKLQEW
jgi:hypothetical protein